jgi:hypothetical protein
MELPFSEEPMNHLLFLVSGSGLLDLNKELQVHGRIRILSGKIV